MQSLREAPFARSVFARRIEQDRANHSRFGRATSHPTTNYLGSRLRSANRDIAEGGQPMAAPRWFAARSHADFHFRKAPTIKAIANKTSGYDRGTVRPTFRDCTANR